MRALVKKLKQGKERGFSRKKMSEAIEISCLTVRTVTYISTFVDFYA